MKEIKVVNFHYCLITKLQFNKFRIDVGMKAIQKAEGREAVFKSFIKSTCFSENEWVKSEAGQKARQYLRTIRCNIFFGFTKSDEEQQSLMGQL